MTSFNLNLNENKPISNISCEIGSTQSSASSNASHLLFNYENNEIGDICTFSERENKQDINTEEVIINKAKEKITAKNLTNEDIKNILLNTNFNINNHNENELDKNIEEINLAIKTLQDDNVEINVNSIIKRVNDHSMLIESGWSSIESFRKTNARNNESLSERVIRFSGLPKGTKLSDLSNKNKYIEKYFAGYFKDLKKQGKSEQEIKKLLLTDFSKLVYNTNEEDRIMFTDAIVSMSSENRCNGFALAMKSLDIESKNNFALTFSNDGLKSCTTERDYWGNHMSDNECMELTLNCYKYLNSEQIEKITENYSTNLSTFATSENSARLQEIRAKITQEIPLTLDDEDFLQEYNYYKIQEQSIGVSAFQKNAFDEVLKMLGKTREQRLDMNGEYRAEVERKELEEFVEYVEEYAEELGIEETIFEEFMDEVTNGNFSIVLDNIKNGTDNPLNSFEHNSTEQVEKSNSGVILTEATTSTEEVSGSIGFTQTTTIPPQITAKQEPFVEEVAEETSRHLEGAQKRTTSIRDVLTVPGEFARKISDFVHEKGVLTATTELLDSGDNTCRKAATKFMDILGDGVLNVLYDLLSTVSGRLEFIKHARASVLSGLKEVDSTTTEIKEQREEELREQGLFLKA